MPSFAAPLRSHPGLRLVGAELADGVTRRPFAELELAVESFLGVSFLKIGTANRVSQGVADSTQHSCFNSLAKS